MANIQTSYGTELLAKQTTAAESLVNLVRILEDSEYTTDGIERVQQQLALVNEGLNLGPHERIYE